jgi:DNA-binding MurR/RpiR family transcriptional regulator
MSKDDVPLLEYINEVMGTLKKSERKVAQLVSDNPSFAINSTVAALSNAAGVSEPTVMRFCTSLGFEGFQQFKIALAQTLALGISATLSTIQQDDSILEISTKVFDHTITSLDRARRFLNVEKIEQAVEAILRSTRLNFAGFGASSIIAQDAAQKESLFGVPCSAPADAHQQYMAASLAKPGSITVAISNTGTTLSVLQIAETARANGALVIGITGDNSPLFDYCDIPLIVKTIEDTDVYTPTVSRLAGLVLIDILATSVALRRGTEHMKDLTRMKEGLATFRREHS